MTAAASMPALTAVRSKPAAEKTRVPRGCSNRYVNIADIKIDPEAQRELLPGWVKARVGGFDPDKLGTITVNRRDGGELHAIDGQHRVELLRAVGWGDQSIFATYFEGLTQAEEAALFLALNDNRPVSTFAKFKPRVTAGEAVASDIQRIVNLAGFAIAKNAATGHITAVASLEYVYRGGRGSSAKGGPAALAKTLKTIDAAWGREAANFNGHVIEGVGLVHLRYASVNQEALVAKLTALRGGAAGLVAKGGQARDVRGGRMGFCVAGVIVDLYNKGRRAGKLEDWWAA